MSEILGVFLLVVTVGLNVIMFSPAVAFSAAAALRCMIYSLGDISGAHFNPAVTLAVVASGRKKCSLIDGIIYGTVHIFAGVFTGLLFECFHSSGPSPGKMFGLAPGGDYIFSQAGVGELFFTLMLAYVVLSVATTTWPRSGSSSTEL